MDQVDLLIIVTFISQAVQFYLLINTSNRVNKLIQSITNHQKSISSSFSVMEKHLERSTNFLEIIAKKHEYYY